MWEGHQSRIKDVPNPIRLLAHEEGAHCTIGKLERHGHGLIHLKASSVQAAFAVDSDDWTENVAQRVDFMNCSPIASANSWVDESSTLTEIGQDDTAAANLRSPRVLEV